MNFTLKSPQELGCSVTETSNGLLPIITEFLLLNRSFVDVYLNTAKLLKKISTFLLYTESMRIHIGYKELRSYEETDVT